MSFGRCLGLQDVQGPLEDQPACSTEQDAPNESRSCEVPYSMNYARLAIDQDVDLLVPSVLITPLAVGMTLSESVN